MTTKQKFLIFNIRLRKKFCFGSLDLSNCRSITLISSNTSQLKQIIQFLNKKKCYKMKQCYASSNFSVENLKKEIKCHLCSIHYHWISN